MAELYFWKPWCTSLNPSNLPVWVPEHSTIAYFDHGIVYGYLKEHNDKIFKTGKREDDYFTHYAMVYNRKVWRGKSYGGTMTAHGIRVRAKMFYDSLLPMLVDEASLPVPPPSDVERELARYKVLLGRLVDLILLWMESWFPRVGIVWSCWEDYPLVLREAMTLLGRGGEDKGDD